MTNIEMTKSNTHTHNYTYRTFVREWVLIYWKVATKQCALCAVVTNAYAHGIVQYTITSIRVHFGGANKAFTIYGRWFGAPFYAHRVYWMASMAEIHWIMRHEMCKRQNFVNTPPRLAQATVQQQQQSITTKNYTKIEARKSRVSLYFV